VVEQQCGEGNDGKTSDIADPTIARDGGFRVVCLSWPARLVRRFLPLLIDYFIHEVSSLLTDRWGTAYLSQQLLLEMT
jgi:hypothetical protein